MNTRQRFGRRGVLKPMRAAGVAPWVVPAHVLGTGGRTSPSGKLTLGVIGVGAQGQGDRRNFLAQEDVRVTAICDVNQRNVESARKHIATAYGSPDGKVFADFRERNADRSIDAVLLALPFHWHSMAALDALGHGKHIFHEKPMALSLMEAQRVRAAVRKTGVVFQFGTQQRSDLQFRWACALARHGRLGKMKEIQVTSPGGAQGPLFPEQPVPQYVDGDRWAGPAPMTSFHEAKLQRPHHENITNFSLGMIACWGIHHLDIAPWGNGTDATGARSVEGTGEFPKQGSLDAILSWKVRFEFADATPVTFVSEGTPGFEHGIRFLGESAWVHVNRGAIRASDEAFLRDPQNKYDTMPIKRTISKNHTRHFVEAIQQGTRPLCAIETAVRSGTLCHLALLAVKQGRKLRWDPQAERFVDDDAANAMLQPRPFRGDWKLPEVS
jgi:predicted dehydrogenase